MSSKAKSASAREKSLRKAAAAASSRTPKTPPEEPEPTSDPEEEGELGFGGLGLDDPFTDPAVAAAPAVASSPSSSSVISTILREQPKISLEMDSDVPNPNTILMLLGIVLFYADIRDKDQEDTLRKMFQTFERVYLYHKHKVALVDPYIAANPALLG